MRSVSVKQLQQDLGRYLDEVRAGEEVVIEERNQPVAKIIPFPVQKQEEAEPVDDPLYMSDEEHEAYVAQMIAEGKIIPPQIEPTPEFWEEFLNEPLPAIRTNSLVPLISQDRDED